MRTPATSTSPARRFYLALAVGALLTSVACASSPAAPSSAGTAGTTSASTAGGNTSGGSGSLDAALTFCATQINKYRANVGLPPVTRSSDLESYAATAIQHDAQAGVPHQYFLSTNGGGVSMAENQLLFWKGYAVDDVITQGMATMWAEGTSGSHYQVLTGNYSQVGCGVYINGSDVSISQDFR